MELCCHLLDFSDMSQFMICNVKGTLPGTQYNPTWKHCQSCSPSQDYKIHQTHGAGGLRDQNFQQALLVILKCISDQESLSMTFLNTQKTSG